MAKGNLNPADAYRKAQRKKEIKKNKAERTKARDFALVKKDTSEIEEEINQLESNNGDKGRLAELKAELEKINKKKEEYVEEHPEQKNLVYRRRRRQGDEDVKDETEAPELKKRNYFNKKGLPRHPERSIYYDPVMNPYGVPPPGMPYMERPLKPDEVDGEAEDSDDGISVPTGLPPGYELVESDDAIFMPDGPPPIKQGHHLQASTPPQSLPTPVPPPPFPPTGFPVGGLPPPPPFPSMVPGVMPPPPPPPPGFVPGMSFPPPGLPLPLGMAYPPPVPPGFATPFPPPPGFFPRNQSISSIQDPLSSVPHTTYQTHRANQTTARSFLPHNPSLPPKPTGAAKLANATVVAEAQLRDLKKEATSFVPNSLKRKKAGVSVDSGPKVDAAPSVGPSELGNVEETDASVQEARPDLVGMLKNQFGGVHAAGGLSADPKKTGGKKNDDYAKFMEEMSDIL